MADNVAREVQAEWLDPVFADRADDALGVGVGHRLQVEQLNFGRVNVRGGLGSRSVLGRHSDRPYARTDCQGSGLLSMP
jgi:hypothetical protein